MVAAERWTVTSCTKAMRIDWVSFPTKEAAVAKFKELIKTGDVGGLFKAVRLYHIAPIDICEELQEHAWK